MIIATGATEINRVVNRQQNTKRMPRSELSAAKAKSVRKDWHGDGVVYYLWAIINGIKYGYVGFTKIRDDEDEERAVMRRGHEHIVAQTAIGKYLLQANPGDFGHHVIKPLYNVDSNFGYGVEGYYIDLLNTKAQATNGGLVRVNIHNNTKDYPDAIRQMNTANTTMHKTVGSNSYTVSDIRKGAAYAKKVKRSRDIAKTLDYGYRVNLVKMIINKGMALSAQGTMDWLVSNNYLPTGIGRTIIYRWHKEALRTNGDIV